MLLEIAKDRLPPELSLKWVINCRCAINPERAHFCVRVAGISEASITLDAQIIRWQVKT
jgi:hypothetical protein